MVRLRRFCAKCGKEILNGNFSEMGYLCDQCYRKTFLDKEDDYEIPQNLQLRRCVMCGAFSLRDRDKEYEWKFIPEGTEYIDFLSELLYEDIFEKLESRYNVEYNLYLSNSIREDQTGDIEAIVNINTGTFEIEKMISIKRREIHCPYCAEILGGRFVSVLQIRIQHKRDIGKLNEIIEECKNIALQLRHENPKNYISTIEKVSDVGYDIKLSNNKMLKTLSSKLRAKYLFEFKSSKRLMGIDPENGSMLYRKYISLKLIPVSKGDFIIIEDTRFHVDVVTDTKVIIRNMKDDKVEQLNFDAFHKKKWRFDDDER